MADAAPSDVRVIVVDLPDSPSTTLSDQEAAIEAAVRACSDGPVTLVGHSLGAHLVGRVLPRLGERVAHAVMIGGFAQLPSEMATNFAGLADALDVGALPAEQCRAIVHDLMSVPDLPSAAAEERIAAMMLEPSDRDLARMIRRSTEAKDQAVAPFATPCSVVHGTEDRAVPIALGAQLQALGAHARWVPVEGAGHFVHLFHAHRVAAICFGAR